MATPSQLAPSHSPRRTAPASVEPNDGPSSTFTASNPNGWAAFTLTFTESNPNDGARPRWATPSHSHLHSVERWRHSLTPRRRHLPGVERKMPASLDTQTVNPRLPRHIAPELRSALWAAFRTVPCNRTGGQGNAPRGSAMGRGATDRHREEVHDDGFWNGGMGRAQARIERRLNGGSPFGGRIGPAVAARRVVRKGVRRR